MKYTQGRDEEVSVKYRRDIGEVSVRYRWSIGEVSTIAADMCVPTYRPIWYIGGMSTECRSSIDRDSVDISTMYRPSIGRVSIDTSTDISVDVLTEISVEAPYKIHDPRRHPWQYRCHLGTNWQGCLCEYIYYSSNPDNYSHIIGILWKVHLNPPKSEDLFEKYNGPG